MSEPIYIAGKKNSSLAKACQQVFRWAEADGLIVVIWHRDWKDDGEFWGALANTMSTAEKGSRTLIAFFGDSIEEMLGEDGGDRLPLIFRLLGRDTDSRDGCCRITDFKRLDKMPISFDPTDQETALIVKSNKIMGLCHNEPKNSSKPA